MTNDKTHVAVQTDGLTPTSASSIDRKYLAERLKKLLPLVERELSKGITNVFEFELANGVIPRDLSISIFQALSIQSLSQDSTVKDVGLPTVIEKCFTCDHIL